MYFLRFVSERLYNWNAVFGDKNSWKWYGGFGALEGLNALSQSDLLIR